MCARLCATSCERPRILVTWTFCSCCWHVASAPTPPALRYVLVLHACNVEVWVQCHVCLPVPKNTSATHCILCAACMSQPPRFVFFRVVLCVFLHRARSCVWMPHKTIISCVLLVRLRAGAHACIYVCTFMMHVRVLRAGWFDAVAHCCASQPPFYRSDSPRQ